MAKAKLDKLFGSSKKRLLSIFWATEITLAFVLVQRFIIEGAFGLSDLIIFFAAILLTPVYYFSHKNQLEKGSGYILVLLTITLSFLAWISGGVRDEVIFGFPAIIFFAAMMENKKLLISLFAIIFLNILLLGLANELNIFVHKPSYSNLTSALLILTIFSVITYGITSVVNDLTKAKREIERHRESLELKVKERTAALESSILQLTETQEQLIESEKMASLGRMVAGVAHEINTPVGIGVTAATHGLDEVEKFEHQLNSGELAKSHLISFINNQQHTLSLIYSNLERAANLVENFKKSAVEQTSESITTFKLNETISDIIDSLMPKLIGSNVEIDFQFDRNVNMTTSQGALAQVLTNLFINALIHGFEKVQQGQIVISTKLIENDVVVTFKDNGQGMPSDVLSHIFEPFYTTKRNKGGSGLGMHIVYNLVTKSLNGTIQCQSKPQKGTSFFVQIPVNNSHS